jgi:crotonobetainyl-CoA:carnitine CoA-transferase CaiB-like acyl-CoA transferase
MIAAPMTASLLADYGADVVKIERPVVGDHVRGFGAQRDGVALYWKTLSRGKRSVAIDLHLPAAQALIRRWITQFDVLIENFRPGTLEGWGLDPEKLLELAPHLVILRVTAYGQDGPYRDRPGFGTLAEALAGLAGVSGYADGPPLLPAFPLADIMAGQLGTAAVLAAVHNRSKAGRGEVIDLAIYEAAMKLIELNIIEYDQLGVEPVRSGNIYRAAAPRGAYLCSDGRWVVISGSTQKMAEQVLRSVGGDALFEDPRFRTNADRALNVDELDRRIADWCRTRTCEEAIAELVAKDCAVGPLETMATIAENPQIVARQSLTTVSDPTLGDMLMVSVVPKFMGAPLRPGTPGPSGIGQDTIEVLQQDLRLSPQELQVLIDSGAIATTALGRP